MPYCNETLSTYLAHEYVISLEYQLDRRENKDFLSIVNSWASSIFLHQSLLMKSNDNTNQNQCKAITMQSNAIANAKCG